MLVAQQSFILKQITTNSINASTIIYLIILDREIFKIAIYCVPFTNHVLQWYWSSKHYVRNTYTTMALVCYVIP